MMQPLVRAPSIKRGPPKLAENLKMECAKKYCIQFSDLCQYMHSFLQDYFTTCAKVLGQEQNFNVFIFARCGCLKMI